MFIDSCIIVDLCRRVDVRVSSTTFLVMSLFGVVLNDENLVPWPFYTNLNGSILSLKVCFLYLFYIFLG